MSDGSACFSHEAYAKVLLHAAKYPWAAVNGLLLGSVTAHDVVVQDAVPLFHTSVLAPMLEVAMMLVDEYCASEQSGDEICIVGFYHANSRNNDSEIPALARLVSEKIAVQKGRTACLVMVKPTALAHETTLGLAAHTLIERKGEWKICAVTLTLSDNDSRELLRKLLMDGKQELLVDFDSHLQDVSLDWRNPDLCR